MGKIKKINQLQSFLGTVFHAPGLWVFLVAFFTINTARADFTLLMRDATSGSVSSSTAAETLLSQPDPPVGGSATNGGWTYRDYTVVRDVIDVPSGGKFTINQPYPDGTTGTGKSNFVCRATANVIIPAGTWTVGFGSDDGGVIKIPGITFTSRFRTNGTQLSASESRFNGTRGHAWTGGTFTVATATETTIECIMFESGGGDSFELGFAQGTQGDYNANWKLMQNGVFGWTVQVAALADLEPPVVTELSPADGATGVFRSTDLAVTFDEEIALTPAALAGTLNVTITDNTPGDGTVGYSIPLNDPSVTVAGPVIIIASPGVLQVENNYTVQIDANAIQDTSTDNGGGANVLNTAITWSFTTPALDPNSPVLVNTSPQDDAILVKLDEVLTATFDRGVAIGSGNIYIYDVAGDAIVQTIDVTNALQVSVSGPDLIIDAPQPFSPEKEYAIRWDAGIVQNYTDVACGANTGNSWSFTTTSASLANSVIITNPSFEYDTVADNAYGPSSPAHWVLEVDQGAVQYSGVWNPPNLETWSGNSQDSYYSDSAGGGGNVPEGVNIAFVTPQDPGTQAGFAQVLADAYMADNPGASGYPANHEFINGVDYQLKVRLGRSKNYPATGYRVQLLAGNVILAEDINSIPLSQSAYVDSFVELTLEYLYNPANAYLAGEKLKIRLLSLDDISTPLGGGASMDFDDVSLTYGYTSPLADPGGPYTVTPTYKLFLDGSGSRPADLATILLYEWDLNNDGVFGDVANSAQPEPGGLTNVDLIGTYGLKLGDNTIALRITDSSGKESIATTNVRIDYDYPEPTPGADFVLIADQDDDGDERWEDLAAGNPSGLELLLDNQLGTAVTRVGVTSARQITHAYDFPLDELGFNLSTGAALVDTNGTTARSFQDAVGDWTDNSLTLEIWFKPGDLMPQTFDGQVLFEDGGDAGLGLYISNDLLVCSQGAGASIITTDISGIAGDFIQAVVTREANGDTRLYVNGAPVGAGPTSGGGADWSDGDAACFGSTAGFEAGGLDNAFADVEAFVGQIAIVRMYSDQVLTANQVLDNYNAVGGADNVPPFAENFSPPDEATHQLITTSLQVTFDSDVTLSGSGTVTLKNLSGGSDRVIAMNDGTQVQINGRVLTINPTSDLDYGTTYAVRITGDAVTDTAGTPNFFPGTDDDTTWNFSTVSQDLTAPVLVGMNPPDNAFDVSPAGIVLRATFDDAVLAGVGNIVINELDPETGAPTLHATIAVGDASQVSIAGNVLSIAPSIPLVGGRTYSVRIAAGAITNTSYVDFAGIADDTTWNFLLGTPLFTDNFEFPDVSVGESGADTSQRVLDASEATTGNPAKWVMSTVGFGADLLGIVDEGSGQVTDPTGQQAFAFRAGGTGLTTAKDTIGNLLAGVTYRISFNVVEDGTTKGTAYNVSLVTFDNSGTDADRVNALDVANGTTSVLHTVTGNAAAGGAYQTVSFEYTVPQGHAALGDDLALRFMGTSMSAMIDNVNVALASTRDKAPPYVISIVDNVGGGPVIVGADVAYTVAFIEDIQAVSLTAADFSNAGSTDITITSVTETDETSGIFQVVVSTGSVGTLRLQINQGAVVLDMGGNALNTSAAILDDTLIIVNTDVPNDPPAFTADPFSTADAAEDVAYSATIAGSATDPDALDTLTYSKIAGPAWLIVAGDGTLSGTPTNLDVGLNAFTIGVTDGKLVFPIEATLNITVINTNDAPFFNLDPIAAGDATEDAAYSGSLAAFVTENDPGDVLTFVKVSGPAWLSVASDGTLSGTPLAADVGANAFTVSVTDSNIPSPIEATLNIEVLPFNDTPFVDAGDDRHANLIQAASVGWSFAPWTGDADSGVSSDYTYTVAHSFGNNNASGVTVNGVSFTENFNSFGPGWNITAGSQNNWNGNDDATVTGQSEKLAQEFIYNGNPRKMILSGLTPGQAYEANFYSAAWENGTRAQTFSATGAGLTDTVINQDQYGNNNGIRITCVYVASATTQEFVITPVGGGTFHLYAFSNHETNLSGATVALDGFASDEEGGLLTYSWTDAGTGTGGGTVSFSDATILNPTATINATGSYVLRLTADDGNSSYDDLVTIYVVEDFTAPTLASTDIVDDRSGAAVGVGTTVTYTVTFSEDMDMSTIGATDFSNAGTSPISIGAISRISAGVITVKVTPTDVGSLQLRVVGGAVLTDLVGNALNTTSAILDNTTITVNAAVDPYVGWAGGFTGLSNTTYSVDFDGGGLPTGLEWVFGGDPTSAADDNSIRPTFDGSGASSVTFTFRRATAARDDSANTTIAVEYGTDMSFGSTAVDGVGGVSYVVTPDGGGAGVDLVAVTIPKDPGGKLFVRLKVTVTTPP